MKQYRILFEDPETGLDVPRIIVAEGEDFFEAIENARDGIIKADGLPVLEQTA